MSISRPALVLALALAPACAESPSVELRWRIQAEDLDEGAEPPELTSIRQCTAVGISKLRLTTRQDGFPVDVRELPCFPEEFDAESGLAPGPELDAGTYELTLQGLRRSTGTPWAEGVSVSADVTISNGAVALLEDLVLPAPPTCDDGIDNDGDGYVDSADIDCRVTDPRESNQVTNIQFFVSPSFLGDNPYVTCGTVGVTTFRLRVDDDPSTDRVIGCSTLTSSFSRRIDPDVESHSVSITGLNFDNVAVTETKVTEFTVTGAQGKPVDVDATFSGDDLLTPLNAPIQFIVAFETGPDADKEFRYCAADAGSTLEITDLTARVIDLDTDQPVDAVLVGGDLDGTALDGTPFACQATQLVTEPLEWGNYGIELSGRSEAGDVCFSAEPLQAAPGILISVILPRSSTDGSCAD